MSAFGNSNIDTIRSKCESLTLQDIIDKKNNQTSKQNRSKRTHFTYKNPEYQTLEEYIRDAQASDDDVGSNKFGKFDRISMRDDMSDDDNEVNQGNKIDPEQEILDELEEAAKYVQKADPEEIDALFVDPQLSTSGYQRNRITFGNRTQQANLTQQQRGGGNSRYTWNNRSGFTRRNNRNWDVQHNRNGNRRNMQYNASRGGKVFKKGSFNYKLADRRGVANGIIGIERAAPKCNFAQTPQWNAVQQPIHQVQPININVNVDGLFNGLARAYQMRDPAPARPPSPVGLPIQSRLGLADDQLLAAIQENLLKKERRQAVSTNNHQVNVKFNTDSGSVTSNKTLNLRFA